MELKEIINLYTFIGSLEDWEVFLFSLLIIFFSFLGTSKAIKDGGMERHKIFIFILTCVLVFSLTFYLKGIAQGENLIRTRANAIKKAFIEKKWERISFDQLSKDESIKRVFENIDSTYLIDSMKNEFENIIKKYDLEFDLVKLKSRDTTVYKGDTIGVKLVDIKTLTYIKNELIHMENELTRDNTEFVSLIKSILLHKKGNLISYNKLFSDYRYILYNKAYDIKEITNNDDKIDKKKTIQNILIKYGAELTLIDNISLSLSDSLELEKNPKMIELMKEGIKLTIDKIE